MNEDQAVVVRFADAQKGITQITYNSKHDITVVCVGNSPDEGLSEGLSQQDDLCVNAALVGTSLKDMPEIVPPTVLSNSVTYFFRSAAEPVIQRLEEKFGLLTANQAAEARARIANFQQNSSKLAQD